MSSYIVGNFDVELYIVFSLLLKLNSILHDLTYFDEGQKCHYPEKRDIYDLFWDTYFIYLEIK